MVNDAMQIPLALIRIAGLREYLSQWVSVSFHADPDRKSHRWEFSRWKRAFNGITFIVIGILRSTLISFE